jgi:hypothetical protein
MAMTTQALLTLTALSLLKGLFFGAFFAWLFPPFNRFVARKLSRDAGQLPQAGLGSRMYYGLAVLSGSGFALLDLVGQVSDATGLPGLLTWLVAALFALSAFGTVLINPPKPHQQPT